MILFINCYDIIGFSTIKFSCNIVLFDYWNHKYETRKQVIEKFEYHYLQGTTKYYSII